MSRPRLPTALMRVVPIALVIAIAILGRWLIPSGVGLVPKLALIIALELAAIWAFRRWLHRREPRR